MRLLAGLLCSGCSVIFMERVPDEHRAGQPVHCTATKGFVAWDGAFVAVDALATIGYLALANAKTEPDATFVVLGVVHALDGVVHAASAVAGSGWADACAEARAAADKQATAVVRTPRDPDERKTVYGERPMFCASVSVDAGLCFLDEQACQAELEASGAPACEQRKAVSCFNATKKLDGDRLTVCAVSIKDCETRRAVFAADPDYKVTACGIYRAR